MLIKKLKMYISFISNVILVENLLIFTSKKKRSRNNKF